MRRIDENFIIAGIVWLVLSIALVIWSEISGHGILLPALLHALGFGFAASSVFGLTYRLFPAMRQSKLGKPHFFIYTAGAALTTAGRLRMDLGGASDVWSFASVVLLAGAILFAVVFLQNREFNATR